MGCGSAVIPSGSTRKGQQDGHDVGPPGLAPGWCTACG